MTHKDSEAGVIRYCTRARWAEALALGYESWCDFDDMRITRCHHAAYSSGMVIWPHDSPAPWPWGDREGRE